MLPPKKSVLIQAISPTADIIAMTSKTDNLLFLFSIIIDGFFQIAHNSLIRPK
jgi:hypothetical protein